MENQGFEEEQQQQLSHHKSCPDSPPGLELRSKGSASNADGHVYEDILPAGEDTSILSNGPSSLDSQGSKTNSFHQQPFHVADRISRDAATPGSLARVDEVPASFTRNLTLPFRRGIGFDSSTTSSSVRVTSRKNVNGYQEDLVVDDVFSTPRIPSSVLQNECRPVRRRKKKDCKHCRSKAASIDIREQEITDVETVLRKNRDNEQRQQRLTSNSSDPRNFLVLPTCSPIRKVDESTMMLANNPSPVFTSSAKVGGSPASTFKFMESERNDGRANLVNSTKINEDNGLTVAEKNRADMRVNSIYSQDRWYAKDASIFFTDVKEHGSFQRAYSLPARTQTPSSQNRINLRRSVRGEPPPHPARLRKHRHGWTLHLAHPLEASGCTRSLILLLIALLLLLGIGGVALYIAFEPEKLQIIQQYLRSSANQSTSNDDVLAAGTFLHRSNGTTSASTTTTMPLLASSTLLNLDRSFPESGTPLTSEAETEANSPSSLNSTRYCDDCLTEEVCVALVDEEVPTCRLPLDSQDPTGCAGFCLINKQKCHRLDVDAFRFVPPSLCRIIIYPIIRSLCKAVERTLNFLWFSHLRRCVEMEHYCLDDEWTCLNTLCIPLKKHCDGHMNCYDHSDEYNCVCDLETHFQCGNETSCLPLEKRCDGKIDCWDAADEINCTLGRNLGGSCPSENEFPCSNGQCILKARFCDGLPDCLDGSDEPHGCQGRCNKHEFTCQNGRCITKGMKCNGVDDCGDGTDERHCKERFS
ncbi:Sortilin-related receptor [Anthophora plagiata]